MTAPSSQETHRLESLDLIRGLAALIVVIWHCYATLSEKIQSQFTAALVTPLRILTDGRPAVIVFFVLSGFVLALPYFSANQPLYRPFLIKRLFRIYLPFAAAILFAAGLYSLTDHGPPGPDWGVAVGWIWNSPDPMTFSMIVQHLLMTGMDDGLLLDGPVWSLVYELRISIIFPVLVFVCRRSWLGLLITVMIAAGTYDVKRWGQFIGFPTNAADYFSTFLVTAYFIPCFLLGILLAKHRVRIHAFLGGLPRYQVTALWAAVVLPFYLYNDFAARITLSLAAGLLMMLSLSSPTALKAAKIPAFRWLGNISYSLYLVHLPILFFLIQMLHRDLSHWSISAITIILSLATASLMRRFVEVPSIRLGKILAGNVGAWQLLDRWRGAAVLTVGAIVVLYAQATYQRSLVWRAPLTLWQNVVSARPNTARVHYYLGEVAMTQDRLSEAVTEFQAALDLDPAFPLAHFNLANVYAAQGRLKEAIQEFEIELQFRPDVPEVHTNLGVAYARQGRWTEAIQESLNALRLRPDFPEAHYNLGNAYASQGRLEEAIQAFRVALRLQPDHSDAHNNLGNAYANQGRLEEAIQEYRAALRLQPDLPDAHNNLGNAYASQGRLEEAIREFLTALRLQPNFPEAHYNLGNAYARQDRIEEAIQEFVTALQLNPDVPAVHYNLGQAYRLKGLKEDARKEFELALKLNPEFSSARQALQSLHLQPVPLR